MTNVSGVVPDADGDRCLVATPATPAAHCQRLQCPRVPGKKKHYYDG